MSYYFVMVKITIELLEINITSDFFQWDICVQSVRIMWEMCDLWLNIEGFFVKWQWPLTSAHQILISTFSPRYSGDVLPWLLLSLITGLCSSLHEKHRSVMSPCHCTQLWVICSKSLQEHPFLCISASVPLGLSSFLLNLLYIIYYDKKKKQMTSNMQSKHREASGFKPRTFLVWGANQHMTVVHKN